MASCVGQFSSTQKVDSGGETIVRIDTPNPNDVLCGRGGNINSHRGNEQFRAFVEKRKRVYLTARFKREKRLIASSIVNEIRAMDPPGRFLARMGSLKDNNGYWYDIGNEKARDKTSQALRENAPSIRAEIETEINQQRAEMRRQETGEQPQEQQQQQQQQQQPSTIASSSGGGVGSSKDVHGRPIPGSAPSSSMYPPPPLGHHHLHPPGAPIHHGHGHPPPPHPPPPPPPHPSAYNPHQQSHASYTQQYYDYYYHYYGYGAPPPPPPPGYQTGSVPPPHNPSVAAGPAGAVPPAPAPPPPGAPPSGYPPAPSPYWAATQPPPSNVNDVNPALAPGHLTHPATATSQLSSNSATSAITSQVKLAAMAPATIDRNNDNNGNVNHNQEEDDRRMAMALQQQENVMAFEERNRRFGSDRKSSRSSAYCSPGYRPRLLNDRTPSLVDGGIGANGEHTAGGTPTRKKRPAMSDSHFFSHRNPSGSNPASLGHNSHSNSMKSAPQPVGASSGTGVAAAPSLMSQQGIMDHRMAVALQHQEDNAHSHGSNASRKISQSKRGRIGSLFGDVPANFMAWSRGGVAENNDSTATTVSSTMEPNNNRNNSMEMNMSTNHHRESNGYDMDRKPAAASNRDDGNKQELEGLYKQELDGLDHHNDFSCSSFNSRVRVQFKDDSDMLSMSGEGDIIIPLAGINSTGSFTRVRNTFAANNSSNSNSNSKNNHFSPIALNERNQHQPDHHHHQRDDPNRDNKNDNNNSQIHQHRQHQQQDPSLLSQVATHILGTLGGGGGSWKDSDAGPSKRVTTTPTTMPHQDHRQGRNNRNRSPETGVELGQEVVMEVRDESSMPPPQPRGSGVQIDWPSRAGCHTWIPDTIGASASAMFGHNGDGNEQHHDHHQEMAHANDHSLTRHSIYGRADISPINSMDMDFSHSSHVGESRRRNHDDGGGGNSSLLNVFDQKHDDPNPEELLPHIHRSVLQQVPSWDRSFRSRSPLGDASVGGADEMDDSLIRVHSHNAMKPMGHDFRQRYQQPQHHHSQPAQPQTNHHQSQHRDHHQQTQSSPQPQPQQQNYHHESRDMDWEEHAGE